MIALGGVCGPMSHEPGRLYEGGRQFKKHHFGPNPGELGETTPNGHLPLDDLTEVDFWVRNLPRKNTSFRLQSSSDWFYHQGAGSAGS